MLLPHGPENGFFNDIPLLSGQCLKTPSQRGSKFWDAFCRIDSVLAALFTEPVFEPVRTSYPCGNPHNLFVPFYTTKVSGSGIGLVLSPVLAKFLAPVTVAGRPGSLL